MLTMQMYLAVHIDTLLCCECRLPKAISSASDHANHSKNLVPLLLSFQGVEAPTPVIRAIRCTEENHKENK